MRRVQPAVAAVAQAGRAADGGRFARGGASLPERIAHGTPAAMKWLWLAGLAVALVLPLLALFGQAWFDDAGHWALPARVAELAANPNFVPLLGRSLAVSLTVAALVVPLAFGFAYALQRSRIALKPLWRGIALLPLFAPSLLPGIALVYLFGNQGIFKGAFGAGGIYGFWGIVLGETFYTFPHALMVLMAALSLADARLYEAARAMGASPWRTFLTVTLPGARHGLFGAACLVLTLVVTDFGVPKVVGGGYPVLALEAYKAVVGQQQFARGALIGMLLLLPALLTFGVDIAMQRRQRAQMSSRSQVYVPGRDPLRDAFCTLVVLAIGAALLTVLAAAVGASLVRLWPYNLELTLAHYDFDNMDGGGWLAYRNSLRMAAFTALAGTLAIFFGAWLTERTRGPAWLHGVLRAGFVLPMAVPGLVLGLGYVFFFNAPSNPLHTLYGTMTLLVLCNVAHFYTTGHLTAAAALRQLDAEFEAAALSLGVAPLVTCWRVTVPICLPALIDIFRYLFVSAMTTVSAVVFLYSPDTVLAAISVLNMDDAGDTAPAAAMSTLILLTSALACLLLLGAARGWLGRTQAWRAPQG
ncbi:putative 2-aminoethylphosphonate ABC transporter permease subunit [Cupriavidus basilensis]|uniref:2-aminoethylphosphonate ABC transporter permease subunit n=1 Tax=Cupriavidus basilensis TaxID=68895 RepID=A0ABT6ALA5_9BURK|nr:putative 2-aminoethylphosphonate ABC transporter permease subunit [Cupriavidus basilensis]MDF3833356.1 putative 2-aminoethylphosphonate ABC transporter permease subunit [Cupriavidus basilensis]